MAVNNENYYSFRDYIRNVEISSYFRDTRKPNMYQANTDQLDTEQIEKIVNDYKRYWQNYYREIYNYSIGYNYKILHKQNQEDSERNLNKKPVAYGKKIVDTTTNYLFNYPATYKSQNGETLENLKRVQRLNNDYSVANAIGRDIITFGQSYKLFFQRDNGYVGYARISPENAVAIYDYYVCPRMIGFIYFYNITDVDKNTDITKIEYYTGNNVQLYEYEGGQITLNKEMPHSFKQVPVAHYTREGFSGILESVIDIIDAIDTIFNANLDEVEKFASAYLVLKSQIEKISSDDLEDIKRMRTFQFKDDKAVLEYLTKDINNDFHDSVLDFAIQTLHKLSGVPDFESKEFSAQSGVALRYKLLGFENIASSVESIYTQGEQKAIDLYLAYNDLNWESREEYYKNNPENYVDIELRRNLPIDIQEIINHAINLKAVGVSNKTIYEYIEPVTGISTNAEIERIQDQEPDEEIEELEETSENKDEL